MGEPRDPNRVADIWQQAAAKVAGLRREDSGTDGGWNEAIAHASEVLEREAENIRVMGRMADFLITGNTEPRRK